MSVNASQRICALRLPGTSRARFVDAGSIAAELGDWVTIDTGPGEEPGQIVVAPDQWLEPVSMDDVPTVIRRLSDDELDVVAGNMKRAIALIDPAAKLFRALAPSCFLCGLRLTLTGNSAIAGYIGDESADPDGMTGKLSNALEILVHLERDLRGDPETTLLGGSTGLPAREKPETFRELLNQRIDVLRDPGAFAPQGLPRLWSSVRSPHGAGRLVAVDIRHWKATVELENGDEVTCGVDELQKP
ncbi:MAG: hypothetical protein WD401_04290 [Thermomicrobiaceae bacterium]